MNDQVVHRNFVLLTILGMLFVLACALTDIGAPAPTPLSFPTVALPNTANTFDHNSLVGQPAPAFTLTAANGQPYTFTPNDSRKHVIVFYMAYT